MPAAPLSPLSPLASPTRRRHMMLQLLHPTYSPRASIPTLLNPSPLHPRLVYQNSLRLHRNQNEVCGAIQAVSSGLRSIDILKGSLLGPSFHVIIVFPSQNLDLQKVGSATNPDGFHAIVESSDSKELKVTFHVSGSRSQVIYDDVFAKMVEAAQPLPGFRRVKGGKTINTQIPKDILLHILGPLKVNSTAIKKIINIVAAEFVQKEGLNVSKDLRVEESYEELEESFQPGGDFSFNAVIQLKDT